MKKIMSNLENHLINSKECKKLVDEYERINYKEINRTRLPNKPDSKTYSIDIAILQDYLKMISTEMDKKGVLKKGVKISMGKYPEKSTDPKLNRKYNGYQMVFVSPVDLDESKDQNRERSTKESEFASLEEIPNLNYMNICPPN